MVIKNFLTGICVLLAFGATESFGAASIRATTVGASGSATGATSARTGSMRVSGAKMVSTTPTIETAGTASTATGGRMPVLPGGTPKLGTTPKLPTITSASLDGYATEAWTIENFQPIGDYQSAGNYLTESDLDGYATEDYVDDATAGLAPHILIQADSNDVIYYCIAAGCESVPVGTNGYWAEFPTDGLAGADGREIELQKTSTYIQWRYKTGTDTTWKNLVKLSDLKGAPGQDGASPTVTVTQSGETYTMTITNADGTVQTPISWTAGTGTGGGISLGDVAAAGYLNDLSGSTYVNAGKKDGNTGTVELTNITSSRNDITSTSTKLTRAQDVQSYVVDYVAKTGYTDTDNGKIWQITKNDQDQYVLSLVDMPAGLDETALQTYLTTNNYVTTGSSIFGNYQPKATADYRVSKSNGTWQALASSVTSGGMNGVTSKGIFDWGTGAFLAKSGHNDYAGKSVIVDSNGNLDFGSVAPNIQLKYYNNALWYCAQSTPCSDTATPSAPSWASVNISSLNGKTPTFRINACGSKATTSQCIQWAYEGESNWTDLISLDEIVNNSLTGSKYVEITEPDSTGKRVLTIPEAALVLRNTTTGADDDDLVTLGGMRCVTSKTTYNQATPTNYTCKGTRPSGWTNYPCRTTPGYTTLKLMNTCLNTDWGDAHSIPDECGDTKNNGGFSYTLCKGYQEANSGTGTTYNVTTYLLEKPICITVYDYTQPSSPVSITQAASDEGTTDWNHLMSNTNFASAVNNSMYSSVGFYTVIGKNKTGRKCGNENATWLSELDDGCNQIMQSSKYNYYICTVGTTGSTVNSNTTYLYRKPVGVVPQPECESTTITYMAPDDITGNTGAGTEANPYTKRGYTTTTITNSCENTANSSYVADSCEYVSSRAASGTGADAHAADDIMLCTYGDGRNNNSTYYLKVKGGVCGLMLVDESYTAPNGNDGSYNSSTIYKTKGVKTATYLNPCTGTTKNSAIIDNDCHLVDMGDLRAQTSAITVKQTVDSVYSCTCGGKPSSNSGTPCDDYTATAPKSYYWKSSFSGAATQCEVTTTEYIQPKLSDSTSCGTTMGTACDTRGYSKTTTKHNCSTDTDTVTYSVDSCRIVQTQYDRGNNLPAWSSIASVTVHTIYECVRNNTANKTNMYYLKDNGGGVDAPILLGENYEGPKTLYPGTSDVYTVKGKMVKTYLDPSQTTTNSSGVVTTPVTHENVVDSCVLEQMNQMQAEGPAMRSGDSGIQETMFRYECTCGGIDGVCAASNTTYKWQSGVKYQIKTCSYKIATASSDRGQYQLKKYCSDDDTGEDVGGVCTSTVEYTAPSDQIIDDSYANVCRGNNAKCYATPGKTTTTPFTDVDGTCQAGTATSVEDTCDVDAELSYNKSNTGNYTYYNCSNGETTYYLRKQQTPYFKGFKEFKEDVGQPATGNTLATGLFLTASEAQSAANTAAATANTVSSNLATLTTNVNKLGDALLGTSECRAPRGGGNGLGTSSDSETDCSTAVTLTSVLMSYFDSMCSNGNAACTASTSLQQLLDNSTSLPSESKENN